MLRVAISPASIQSFGGFADNCVLRILIEGCMKRFQVFEIEDQAWLPNSIRDALTDYLQFVTDRTQPYAPIIPQLENALEQTRARQIVDLCSGGSGPWLSQKSVLLQSRSVKVLLTDKFPNVEAFRRAAALSDDAIEFTVESVDATNVPDEMLGFRTLYSSFHHFRPEQARAILSDAVGKNRGIGVFEATHRSALAILLMFITPFLALIFTPFIRPFRWSRLFWTYLVPVVPFIILFDAIVSCLRTYTPAELETLSVEASSGMQYKWEIGEQRGERQPLPVTYLLGYPTAAEQINGHEGETATLIKRNLVFPSFRVFGYKEILKKIARWHLCNSPFRKRMTPNQPSTS